MEANNEATTFLVTMLSVAGGVILFLLYVVGTLKDEYRELDNRYGGSCFDRNNLQTRAEVAENKLKDANKGLDTLNVEISNLNAEKNLLNQRYLELIASISQTIRNHT